jgi:pilus assembly protein CpaB
MNRRALGIALVVAIIGIALMLLYQQRFEQEASGGERVAILQLTKQVERGTILTDDMLTVRKVPLAYIEDRAVKESEKNMIVGVSVGNRIKAQQTLMWTDIVSSNDERKDLSQLVIPGYRAVTVRVAREDTSVALVRPGDYVDVVAVIGSGEERRTAAVILQKILVLATANDTSQARDEKRVDARDAELLTLALRLEEAQMVSLALDRGKLTVAVRPPSDTATQESVRDFGADRLLNPTSRPQIRGGSAQPTGPVNIGINPRP